MMAELGLTADQITSKERPVSVSEHEVDSLMAGF